MCLPIILDTDPGIDDAAAMTSPLILHDVTYSVASCLLLISLPVYHLFLIIGDFRWRPRQRLVNLKTVYIIFNVRE